MKSSGLPHRRDADGAAAVRGRGRGRGEPMRLAHVPLKSASGTAPQGRGARGGGRGRGNAGLDALSPEQRAEYDKRLAEIDAKLPPAARANVKDFVNHIDYAVKLIGIDHVGISSDFDGGGGIDGWNSAAEAFNVTLELVRRGYTEEQIGKMWSGNLLRVWGEVEKVAQKLQKETGLKAAPIRAAPVRERMNAVWGRLATCGPIANRFQASRARPAPAPRDLQRSAEETREGNWQPHPVVCGC